MIIKKIKNVLRPLYKAWMKFAALLNWLTTRIILIILFYIVMIPTSLLARLLGKKFLTFGFDKMADSYWLRKQDTDIGKNKYIKQF